MDTLEISKKEFKNADVKLDQCCGRVDTLATK